jgi:hypothetical protein
MFIFPNKNSEVVSAQIKSRCVVAKTRSGQPR